MGPPPRASTMLHGSLHASTPSSCAGMRPTATEVLWLLHKYLYLEHQPSAHDWPGQPCSPPAPAP